MEEETSSSSSPSLRVTAKRAPRWVRHVSQIAFGLVVGLVLAEGAFWARDSGAFPHLNVYEPDPALGVRLRPGATEKISFGGNPVTSVSINKQGFRGHDFPPPGPNDVLVVGDSQVFGLGVERNQIFTSVLEKSLGHGAHVLNAGVPTYGPEEYLKVIENTLGKRKVKTVVYVVNYVNDPFEVHHPNTRRHVVWDGWAVRYETAPQRVRTFPGRSWLYGQSHAVFALRQWMYGKQTKHVSDDRGFRSEGTWTDLVKLPQQVKQERKRAAEAQEREARRQRQAAKMAKQRWISRDLKVKLLTWKALKLDNTQAGSVYNAAAQANPGDIVVPQMGEEGRPLAATAKYVREAMKLRVKFENELRQKAKEAGDTKTLEAIKKRDELEKKLPKLFAGPVKLARESLPMLGALRKAEKVVESHGARLVVLVLPIDVQVSKEEWKKYPGAKPVEMKGTELLLQDLVQSMRKRGVSAMSALAPLKKAEPGAFLLRDPHMSPKGHEAVGKALAKLIESKPPQKAPAPRLALRLGRSRIPAPEAWSSPGELAVHGSTAAHCVTKRIREWLFVRCAPDGHGRVPTGVVVTEGGEGEAMVMRRGEFIKKETNVGSYWNPVYQGKKVPGDTVTLIAPIAQGRDLRAVFTWDKKGKPEAKRLVVHWPTPDDVEPDIGFEKAEPTAMNVPTPVESALCTCFKKQHKTETCRDFLGADAADCVDTYRGDCERMLLCASGFVGTPPRCREGQTNAGAALHCYDVCDKAHKCKEGARCVDKQGAKLCVSP